MSSIGGHSSRIDTSIQLGGCRVDRGDADIVHIYVRSGGGEQDPEQIIPGCTGA